MVGITYGHSLNAQAKNAEARRYHLGFCARGERQTPNGGIKKVSPAKPGSKFKETNA
jgi:hypothetical protein